MYKLGAPIVHDTEYDQLVEEISKYVEVPRRWDYITDEEGLQLMKYFGITVDERNAEIEYSPDQYVQIVKAMPEVVEEYLDFKVDENRSIPIVTDNELFERVYSQFRDANTPEILASLKLDGWNISLFIKNGQIVYAHTRGKQAEVTDVTSIMKAVLKDIDGKFDIEKGYVVGELYLESDSLPYLRDKYNKDFKNTRNSISTFINNKVVAEDMPVAQFGAFKLEIEGRSFNTPKEMYEELHLNGFKIPKHELIQCDLSEMARLVIEWGKDINHLPPSDGIVFQPNSYLVKNSLIQIPGISGSYEVGLYAIKMHSWGKQVYKTIIKEIKYTRNTKTIKPSLIVEPVYSRDGRCITTIPIDHIGRLVDEDLFVGKEISIRIVSEKDIRLMYDMDMAEIRRIV